ALRSVEAYRASSTSSPQGATARATPSVPIPLPWGKETGRGASPPPPPSPLLPEYYSSSDSSRSGEIYSGSYGSSLPSSRGSSPASTTPPP
ncbi:hypothetical protein CDAR_568051, partial [Caerostris darwini]